MTTAAEGWAEQARYDLETAQAMLETGRWLYVLFCCQQAIEKILKAIIVDRKIGFPPRTHNLSQLAELASLALSERQADFLNELSSMYIQSRYPEESSAVLKRFGKERANDVLIETEELFQWLCSMLKFRRK